MSRSVHQHKTNQTDTGWNRIARYDKQIATKCGQSHFAYTTYTNATELVNIDKRHTSIFLEPFQTEVGESKECASRYDGHNTTCHNCAASQITINSQTPAACRASTDLAESKLNYAPLCRLHCKLLDHVGLSFTQ